MFPMFWTPDPLFCVCFCLFLYALKSKHNKFQHIGRAEGVVLFLGTAGKHNRNTAVAIRPELPGSHGEAPEHMFVNDRLQRPQWEPPVCEVWTPLHLKPFEWLQPSAGGLEPGTRRRRIDRGWVDSFKKSHPSEALTFSLTFFLFLF